MSEAHVILLVIGGGLTFTTAIVLAHLNFSITPRYTLVSCEMKKHHSLELWKHYKIVYQKHRKDKLIGEYTVYCCDMDIKHELPTPIYRAIKAAEAKKQYEEFKYDVEVLKD
jgi:hypothetical protein